ncbi:MlaD family protein [Solimicrobium silvestre]|uniref:Mce related protein n=1 Tax=Solimicrobium silvestre TaxID=2099400 RepID=A0A2S9H3L6_9BURK|nr:MlaD family protein [Solimicrobium silvestre]PRC94557.1 mce related protein [Solimicrobium silvestre]
MENRSHALWAGFFTIAMLCAAIFAGIWLNRDKTQRIDYQIITSRAISGLNPQASVRYKGLAVGRVDNIDFDTKVAGQIIINISVDPDTPITQSTFATLGYQGVTGIAFVQLDDDGSNSVKLNVAAGTVPRIPLQPGLLEKLERSSSVILANAELVSARLAEFFTPENQKTMLGAFSNTAQATARWTKVADDLSPSLQLIPDLVHQTNQTLLSVQELSQNATQLSQQMTGVAKQLQDPDGPLNHTLSTLSDLSTNLQSETLPKITILTSETSNSMRTFNKTMEELKERPQILIFGKPTASAGPGEAGFVEPKK